MMKVPSSSCDNVLFWDHTAGVKKKIWSIKDIHEVKRECSKVDKGNSDDVSLL